MFPFKCLQTLLFSGEPKVPLLMKLWPYTKKGGGDFQPLTSLVSFYPPDSIQWILWITHEYAAAAVCKRFFSYPSRGQGIIGRLLKFAGYIHNHKILPGNIFGLILKNKMAATDVFRLSARSFVGPLEQRVL